MVTRAGFARFLALDELLVVNRGPDASLDKLVDSLDVPHAEAVVFPQILLMHGEDSVATGLQCGQEFLKTPSWHPSCAEPLSAGDTVKRLPVALRETLLAQDERLDVLVDAPLEQKLLLVLTAFLSVDFRVAILGEELAHLASACLKVENFRAAFAVASASVKLQLEHCQHTHLGLRHCHQFWSL